MRTAEKEERLRVERVIENFKKRNIAGYFCRDTQEARQRIRSLIQPEDVVAWGGSMTLDQIGIKEDFADGLDGLCLPRERALEVRKQSFEADVYLTGTNAITEDGELINIDKTGNRVAAMCFGPKKVIVAAGMNKVAKNEAAALARLRLSACVANGIRLGKKTPCTEIGKCADCLISDQTMCAYTVITRFNPIPNRIHVVLIDEELGY